MDRRHEWKKALCTLSLGLIMSCVTMSAHAVILGAIDNTWVVTNQDTLMSYPFRTIGSLALEGISTGCTGTLVGPRHVLTAAHCAYNANGQWFHKDFNRADGSRRPYLFHPGQLAGGDLNGGPFRVVRAYARTYALGWDYALLILADSPALASLGQMGMAWKHDLNRYDDKNVRISGYPLFNRQCADSPRQDGRCGGFMYSDFCEVSRATDGYLMYDCDAHPGHSGAPIYTWDGRHAAVIWGVHKRGNEPRSNAVITSSPPSLNLGPRMRRRMYDDVCTWIGNHPSNFRSHPCDR